LLGSGRGQARQGKNETEKATRGRMEHDATANLKKHESRCAKARPDKGLWLGLEAE
jgi:hypothetical protein